MLRDGLLIQTARVLGLVVVVERIAAVWLVFEEGLLDFPVVLLGANAELEIFFCD